jgi:cob(I)alamin adenosyltransferase
MSETKEHYINVWYGDGSGKTTSALGKVMRAYGQGLNILVVQFLKGVGSCEYGELKTCEKLGIKVIQTGSNKIVLESNKTPADILEAQEGWELLLSAIQCESYDLIVLDELLPVLQLNLLNFDAVIEWLLQMKKSCNLIVTGRIYDRDKLNKIKDISDLMSKIECVRHPFNTRCKSCKIEFNYRFQFCPHCGKKLTACVGPRKGIEF